MEKAPIAKTDRIEFKPENYIDVKPEQVNNFRKQAALFLTNRVFTEDELQKINNADDLSVVKEFEFEDGLTMLRMTFSSKTIMEVYSAEDYRFRIIYNPTDKTVKTTREPRPLHLALQLI